MMLVMSSLNYDAMAVGNHEYNFGLKVLEKARGEANFPWLSANTYETATKKPHYKPYIVKEVGGVRVGILGFTTPGVRPSLGQSAKLCRSGISRASRRSPQVGSDFAPAGAC